MEHKEIDNKWLNPITDLKRAEPSESLYSKIESAVFAGKIIPMQKMRWIAASVLILIAANVYALQQSNSSEDTLYSDAIITDFSIYNYED